MGFEDFQDWAAMGRVTVWCASQFEGEKGLDPNPGFCSLRCLLFNYSVPAKGAFEKGDCETSSSFRLMTLASEFFLVAQSIAFAPFSEPIW